jgi:hypothetical protein
LTPRKFRIALFFPVLYFWWCYFRGFPKFFPALSFNENVQFFIKYLFKTYPVILNEWVPQFFSILYRELSDYGLVYGVIYGFGRFHVYFHTFSFLTLLASFLFFFWGSYEILQRRNIELQPYFWKATPTEMVNNYPLYWFFPAWGRIQEMVHYKIMRKVQDNETEIFEELMWDEDKVARNTAYAELYPPIVYPIAWLLWFPFRMLLFFPLFFVSLPFLFVWWLDYLYAKQHKTLFTPLGCLRRLHRDFFWLLSFPFDIVCGYFYPYYRLN